MFNVNIAYDRIPPFFFSLSIFIDIFWRDGGSNILYFITLFYYYCIIITLFGPERPINVEISFKKASWPRWEQLKT